MMSARCARVLLLVFLLSGAVLAKHSDAQAIAEQLPKRHAVMRVFASDLNADGRGDRLVLARSWDEANNGDVARPLLIFLRQPNGNLKRVARADGVISCRNCGGLVGDPWRRDHRYTATIQFARGQFSIREFAGSGWRGWTVKTFKLEQSRWVLLECRNKVYHLSHAFPVAFNRATRNDFGRVWLEEFGITRRCWS